MLSAHPDLTTGQLIEAMLFDLTVDLGDPA
jgi:hypothetical protein